MSFFCKAARVATRVGRTALMLVTSKRGGPAAVAAEAPAAEPATARAKAKPRASRRECLIIVPLHVQRLCVFRLDRTLGAFWHAGKSANPVQNFARLPDRGRWPAPSRAPARWQA